MSPTAALDEEITTTAERLARYFPPPPQTTVVVDVALVQQAVGALFQAGTNLSLERRRADVYTELAEGLRAELAEVLDAAWAVLDAQGGDQMAWCLGELRKVVCGDQAPTSDHQEPQRGHDADWAVEVSDD